MARLFNSAASPNEPEGSVLTHPRLQGSQSASSRHPHAADAAAFRHDIDSHPAFGLLKELGQAELAAFEDKSRDAGMIDAIRRKLSRS
jgi:hypothetical protein